MAERSGRDGGGGRCALSAWLVTCHLKRPKMVETQASQVSEGGYRKRSVCSVVTEGLQRRDDGNTPLPEGAQPPV